MSEVAVTPATAEDEIPSAFAARLHTWRCGLYRFRQSWTSIAGLVITTEAMVAEAPKKEEAHSHGPAGGGMGGMGGMDF